jgi:hypothetical protein
MENNIKKTLEKGLNSKETLKDFFERFKKRKIKPSEGRTKNAQRHRQLLCHG